MIKLNEILISKIALSGIILSALILVFGGMFYIYDSNIIGAQLTMIGLWGVLISQLMRILLTSFMFYIKHETILTAAALFIFLVLAGTILINLF
jgi:hypothetical protein